MKGAVFAPLAVHFRIQDEDHHGRTREWLA